MARADAGIVSFRAFRIGLIGAAALLVVAAVIALPHLAGRAEDAPPTAPPIAGEALPAGMAAAAADAPEAPSEPPLQRLVPPSTGVLLGVSNPELPRDAGRPRRLDGRARRAAAHRQLVPAVAQRRDAVPRRLGGAGRRGGGRPDGHLGALVGAGGREAQRRAARDQPRAHRRRRSRRLHPLLRPPGRGLPRRRPHPPDARDERPLVLVGRRRQRQRRERLRRGLAPRPPHLRPGGRPQRELGLVDQQPRVGGRRGRRGRPLPGRPLRQLGRHQRLQLGRGLRVELVARRATPSTAPRTARSRASASRS